MNAINEELILNYSALLKLIGNEPMSLNDLKRIIIMIERASFAIETPNADEVAATQSQLITLLQNKFMKGVQIQQ